jgi:hypothetical protein
MKINKWTKVLCSAGLITLPMLASADETKNFVQTAVSATTLSGYIDTTAFWAPGTGNVNQPGLVGGQGATVLDAFSMNVVSLTLAKPLDESEWSSGYNVQMLLGPGASYRGTGQVVDFGSTDISFNEAYVALRVPVGNGIDFKVGQFGTYNGYEAYDTYKNPNWSRSYGFYIESSAHTGISSSYKFCDSVSMQVGIANNGGFNNQVDAKSSIESKKAYMGLITLTAPESMGFLKGATLSGGATVGDAVLAGGAGNVSGQPLAPGDSRWDQANFYIGTTIPLPVTGLSFGLAYDYTSGSAFSQSYANAIAGYLVWQTTEKMKLSLRSDWGWGSNSDGTVQGVFGYTSAGNQNRLTSLTGSIDYALWKNVISRFETRWNYCLTDDAPFGATTAATAGTPLSGGVRQNVSIGVNIIYMF